MHAAAWDSTPPPESLPYSRIALRSYAYPHQIRDTSRIKPRHLCYNAGRLDPPQTLNSKHHAYENIL